MFGKRKAEPRSCPRGHPMEESWERCPYCEAERAPLAGPPEDGNAAGGAPAEPPAEPGTGAVVVPKKVSEVRPLAGWLVALAGEQEGQDFRVHAGRNLLGKGAKADVILRDPYVSERHALLVAGEDGYFVSDLGSKHGTFLNDERVEGERPLRDGDRLRLGRTELRFRSYPG